MGNKDSPTSILLGLLTELDNKKQQFTNKSDKDLIDEFTKYVHTLYVNQYLYPYLSPNEISNKMMQNIFLGAVKGRMATLESDLNVHRGHHDLTGVLKLCSRILSVIQQALFGKTTDTSRKVAEARAKLDVVRPARRHTEPEVEPPSSGPGKPRSNSV